LKQVLSLDLLHTEEGQEETVKYLASQGFQHYSGKGEPVIFINKNVLQ
jgi:hypothetical protein